MKELVLSLLIIGGMLLFIVSIPNIQGNIYIIYKHARDDWDCNEKYPYICGPSGPPTPTYDECPVEKDFECLAHHRFGANRVRADNRTTRLLLTAPRLR